MQDPKLSLVATLTSARTYRFQSADRLGGWALCTVNDGTGELLITSDWGNWAHLWNPKHLGCPSLTHFIATRIHYDYLANKLLGRDGTWVLDAHATIKKWRRALCAHRLEQGRGGGVDLPYLPREQRLDAALARAIWYQLGSLFDDQGNAALFIEHAWEIEGFSHWICERPWEEVEHCYSHAYELLVNFLLPALSKACAETARQVNSTEDTVMMTDEEIKQDQALCDAATPGPWEHEQDSDAVTVSDASNVSDTVCWLDAITHRPRRLSLRLVLVGLRR